MFVYPGFVLVRDRTSQLGVLGLADLNLAFSGCKFVEDERVPFDAHLVGTTWEKVNKNGEPDRRFNENRQVPIVSYGEISIQSETGLNRWFLISNCDAAKSFAEAFSKYQHAISKND